MQRLLAFALAFIAAETRAIEGLRISVVQSNVVLGWPSRTNETFIVQWRAAFDTNTPWTTLATNHLAANDTNWTVFTHTNQIPGNTNLTTMGGGGGGSGCPPPMMMATATPTASSPDADKVNKEKLKKNDLPPVPWDPASWTTAKTPKKNGPIQAFDEPVGDPNAPTSQGFYRVVRTGLSIFGITNGSVLTQSVELPIEVGLIDFGDLASVVLGETNGHSLGGFIHEERSGLTVGKWRTGYSSNGTYVLQATAHLGEAPASTYFSAPTIVVVSNLFSFVDPIPVAGFVMLFETKTVLTSGTFTVHVYGEGSPDASNQILSFGGIISATGQLLVDIGNGTFYPGVQIDMSDNNGNQRPDKNFTVAILAQVGGGQTQAVTNVVPTEMLWPTNTLYVSGGRIIGPTKFTIGFQPIYGDASLTGQSAVTLQHLISAIYTAAETRPFGLGARPGGNQSVNALWNENDFTSWLTSDIRDYEVRNLFYFGHGNPKFIGTTKPLGVGRPTPGKITVADLRQVLGTNHPYRFVFLYGCNTATGDIPLAFGIPKEKMTRSDFADRGLRARAFVGFKNTQWTGIVGTMPTDHATFIGQFFEAWQGTYPTGHPRAGQPRGLKDALILGAQSGNTNKPVWSGYNDLKIYGAEDLIWPDIIP